MMLEFRKEAGSYLAHLNSKVTFLLLFLFLLLFRKYCSDIMAPPIHV